MFGDCNCAGCSGCKAPDFLLCILYKPNIAIWSFGNTVRLASRCGNSIFYKLVSCRIEEANFVTGILGKPDIAIFIEDQIVWIGVQCGNLPLMPCRRI